MGSACATIIAGQVRYGMVPPFSHVCGEIPTVVGGREAVLFSCEDRRLDCMTLNALMAAVQLTGHKPHSHVVHYLLSQSD